MFGTPDASPPPIKRRTPTFQGIPELTEIAVESFHPKALRAKINELNTRVQRAITNRSNLEARNATQEEADVREMNLDNDLFGATRASFVMQLQEELRTREAIDALQPESHAALQAELTRADGAHAKAEADLIEKFVSIGYLHPVNGIPVSGSYIPDFLHRHPGVRAAKEYRDAMFNQAAQNDGPTANLVAIELLESRLSQIRAAAVGT